MTTHYGDWKAIIGLEIHVELNTASKLFSGAPNRFGAEPNVNISPVCTGQPGALPVLNKEAVRKAVQFGCAIGAEISDVSTFDRKSYFYPDSPRNFQITQFERPIIKGGTIVADVEGEEYTFTLDRTHLEDDAGMLKHFSGYAGIDYNRAGVPLIEIVSEPCIHSPKQAAAYAMAVRAILQYLDVSDCNMEEGSLRFDANVSVMHKNDNSFRTKTEIKNMNSFSFMEEAVEKEIQRQIREYTRNHDKAPEEVIQQATYRWDADRRDLVLMRRKEHAEDYRYFPEPDLPPVVLTRDYIDTIRSTLPELPRQRRQRYVEKLKLTPELAGVITADKQVADYFEEGLVATTNAKALGNWIVVEFAGRLKEKGMSPQAYGISCPHIAVLVNMIDDKTITGRIAKQVADDMVAQPGKDPQEIVKANPDYQPMSDTGTIEPIVDNVLRDNQKSVDDYKAGKNKALAFLVGQVMKQTRGKASPDVVNELIKSKIST